MTQHRTIELSADMVQNILDRLEHIVLDVCSLKAWVDDSKTELAVQVIERLDVVKVQLGEI